MTLLTNEQIDNLCKRASGQAHIWNGIIESDCLILDTYLKDLFLNLYNTGLRFHELQDISRWSNYSSTELICNTLKGSNDRVFLKSSLTTYFSPKAASAESAWEMCRYSTANRWLKKAFFPLNIQIGNAGLSTHLFRHNKVKLLYKSGQSVEQISAYLGEKSYTNTNAYINSVVYSD